MSDMEFMKAEEGDLISLLEKVKTSEVPKKIIQVDPTPTPRLLANRQLGGGGAHQISQAHSSNVLAKHTLRINQIKTKWDCCSNSDCVGVPKKNKVTLCPIGTKQVTQLELSKCGKYLYYGTADNRLFLVDLKKLKNQMSEINVVSDTNGDVMEEFKILFPHEKDPVTLELTKTFGQKGWNEIENRKGQMGIHVIELSPGGLKILTSGHNSATVEILETDITRHKGDPEENQIESLKYDSREIWTKDGVIKEGGKNYREGKMTGGTWFDEETIGVVGIQGKLTLCKLHGECGRILIPTVNEIRFPEHGLPLSSGHRFPQSQGLSRLVNISRMSLRDEIIITSDCGEIYILKQDNVEGVTTRGARRIGIPREELCYTDQYKNIILLSQTIEESSNTVIVGTLFGLSILDTRTPHLLSYIKMSDVDDSLESKLEESMMGLPVSLAAKNQIVTAGLWGGFIIYCDLRAKKWILEENSSHLEEYYRKVSWPLGLSGHPVNRTIDEFLPNLYPLTCMKQRGDMLAAGGGPIIGNMTESTQLEGIVTTWDYK